MSKSRFVFDKFAKLIEQGLINYKDVSDEVISILKSKRDEIVFKMKLASKEEAVSYTHLTLPTTPYV